MRIAIGAALWLISPTAAAEDAGNASGDGDGAAPAAPPDGAAFDDAAPIACDGALCESTTGTTCGVAGVSPGRFSPSLAGLFAIVGVIALAAGRRGLAYRSAGNDGAGRGAHLGPRRWAGSPRLAPVRTRRRKDHNKHGL